MNSITFRNDTAFAAQYTIRNGEQVIGILPDLAPGAQISVPTDDLYAVSATAVIDGNTYTTASQTCRTGRGFLARVQQAPSQDTYVFDMVQAPATKPQMLTFQKTCISPVTFAIKKNGKPLQDVVIKDSFTTDVLDTGATYAVSAVIDGFTTATSTFTDPSATITAVSDNPTLENAYFSLEIQ